jgi:D-alanyl-D-alanine carboxypeptidase
VYKSPSDDEQHADGMRDKEGRSSRVRRRQSASPRQEPGKPRKEFYADEHPEVPKIRRASRNTGRTEMPPHSDLEDDELGNQTTSSFKRARRETLPFTGLEDEQAPRGATSPYTRHVRQQGHREMLPFTGLEDDSAYETEEQEKPSRQARTTRKIPAETRGYPRNIPQRGQPRRGKQTAISRFSLSGYVRTPFFEIKKLWLLIVALVLVALIGVPLLINTLHNATTSSQINSNQEPSFPKVQTVPDNPHELVITPPNNTHPAPPVLATSAYLLDANNAATYYAQNPFLHLPMLSTTKLMTAALAVQEGNLDQTITITPAMQQDINQLSGDSALFNVKKGESYTLRDLLYGLLYVSGNDAALVIADALAGNVQSFVTQMNQKAQDLGLHDTHFVNPHGLLNPGQYSCARDLAVLGLYSLSIPILQQIDSGRAYHIEAGGNHGARVVLNENQFLWWYPGVMAGKTGYDGQGDFIQVMLVTRNHRKMIGVVMHTNNWWTDMRDLMNYGSNDYTWVSPHDVDASGQPIPYDNLWNYFADDTQGNTVPTANGGQYYIYTGYSISGPIMDYFNQQGGLQKFGYPTKMPAPAGGSVLSQQFQHGTIQCDFTSKQCRTN